MRMRMHIAPTEPSGITEDWASLPAGPYTNQVSPIISNFLLLPRHNALLIFYGVLKVPFVSPLGLVIFHWFGGSALPLSRILTSFVAGSYRNHI